MANHTDIGSEICRAEQTLRRHPRVLFSTPIMLRRLMPGRGVRVSRGISLDMSAGGMGALVEAGLKVGDIVEIDFNSPQLKLSTVAIVRHSSSVQSGFEFLGLTPEERQSLANTVSEAGNA